MAVKPKVAKQAGGLPAGLTLIDDAPAAPAAVAMPRGLTLEPAPAAEKQKAAPMDWARLYQHQAARFNRGVGQGIGFFGDLPFRLANVEGSARRPMLDPTGSPVHDHLGRPRDEILFTDPMTGGQTWAPAGYREYVRPPIGAAIDRFSRSVGMYDDTTLTPQNRAERYAGTISEFVGAGAAPGGAIARFAKAPAIAGAVDAGVGAAQGAVYEGVKDVTGGNETAATVASLAAPLAPAAGAAAVRGALGGGSRRMGDALASAEKINQRLAQRHGEELAELADDIASRTAGGAPAPGKAADELAEIESRLAALEARGPAVYKPTAGEAGGGFLTRWLERLGQYSVFSGGDVARRMEETDDVMRQVVEDIAGRAETASGAARGSAQTAEGAGIALRGGLRDDASSWMTRSKGAARDADATAYEAIAAAEEAAGAPTRVSVAGVLDTLDQRIARQSTLGDVAVKYGDPDVAGIQDDLMKLAAWEDTPSGRAGTLSLEQARELRAIIGNMTSFNGAAPARDTALWRNIYGQLSDSIGDAVRALPTAAVGNRRVNPGKAWDRAQAAWRQHFRRIENTFDPAMKRAAEPDQLARWAVNVTGRNRPTLIRELRAMVNARRWNQVRGFAVRQLGLAKPSSVEGVIDEATEAFSPATFATNWNRMRQDGSLEAIFGGAAKGSKWAEIRPALDQLARAVGRVQKARAAIANPSGTANRLIAHQQLTTVAGAAAASAMTGNPTILGLMLAAQGSIALGAKAMLSPRFVRWLARDGQLPLARLPSALARLDSAIKAERDAEARAEMEAFRASLEARAQAQK